jgi:hypothetical protein
MYYSKSWMCGVYGGCGFYVSRCSESIGGVVGGQSLFMGIHSHSKDGGAVPFSLEKIVNSHDFQIVPNI